MSAALMEQLYGLIEQMCIMQEEWTRIIAKGVKPLPFVLNVESRADVITKDYICGWEDAITCFEQLLCEFDTEYIGDGFVSKWRI